MKIIHFDRSLEYYERIKDYLLENEASHNIILGIANRLCSNFDRFTDRAYLAVVEDNNNKILAVALRTPPYKYKLILSLAVNYEAVKAIARDIYLNLKQEIPGIIASEPEAEIFAKEWHNLTGKSYKKGKSEYIYQLENVRSMFKVNGKIRKANNSDRSFLIDWFRGFYETLPDPIVKDPKQVTDSFFISEKRCLYIWENNNIPVSMAGCSDPTPNGIRINAVYTPPEYRSKGYATACVASLSQMLLDRGYKYCFLFANITNPTSNYVYKKIGYRSLCQVRDYWF